LGWDGMGMGMGMGWDGIGMGMGWGWGLMGASHIWQVGDGQMSFADGRVYRGGVIATKACPQGGVPHGEGQMTEFDGEVYVGRFEYGLRDGIGRIAHTNGDRFEGMFKQESGMDSNPRPRTPRHRTQSSGPRHEAPRPVDMPWSRSRPLGTPDRRRSSSARRRPAKYGRRPSIPIPIPSPSQSHPIPSPSPSPSHPIPTHRVAPIRVPPHPHGTRTMIPSTRLPSHSSPLAVFSLPRP
jgi:hypothetical protein